MSKDVFCADCFYHRCVEPAPEDTPKGFVPICICLRWNWPSAADLASSFCLQCPSVPGVIAERPRKCSQWVETEL